MASSSTGAGVPPRSLQDALYSSWSTTAPPSSPDKPSRAQKRRLAKQRNKSLAQVAASTASAQLTSSPVASGQPVSPAPPTSSISHSLPHEQGEDGAASIHEVTQPGVAPADEASVTSVPSPPTSSDQTSTSSPPPPDPTAALSTTSATSSAPLSASDIASASIATITGSSTRGSTKPVHKSTSMAARLLAKYGPGCGIAPLPMEVFASVVRDIGRDPGVTLREVEAHAPHLAALSALSPAWHALLLRERARTVFIGPSRHIVGKHEDLMADWIRHNAWFAARTRVKVDTLMLHNPEVTPACAALLFAAFPALECLNIDGGWEGSAVNLLVGHGGLKEVNVTNCRRLGLQGAYPQLERLTLDNCRVEDFPLALAEVNYPRLNSLAIHAYTPQQNTPIRYTTLTPPSTLTELALSGAFHPYYADIVSASASLKHLHLGVPVEKHVELLSSVASPLKSLSFSFSPEDKAQKLCKKNAWNQSTAALLAALASPYLGNLETVIIVGKAHDPTPERWLDFLTSTFEARKTTHNSPRIVHTLPNVIYTPHKWYPGDGKFGIEVKPKRRRKSRGGNRS
ncbi:hypothetical protein JCM10449v2_002018 [Rhodotorula kratochvilovae]